MLVTSELDQFCSMKRSRLHVAAALTNMFLVFMEADAKLMQSGSDLRENSAAPILQFGAGVDLPPGPRDLPKAAQAAAVAPFHLGCPPPAGGLLGEHGGAAEGVRSEAPALLPDGGRLERVSTVGRPAGRIVCKNILMLSILFDTKLKTPLLLCRIYIV